LQACNSRAIAAADCGGMSPPHHLGRRPSGTRIVRELPLVLEPVTRDPFIDDGRRPNVSTIHARQRTLVRESLLRVPGGEERS
jgi:hypothetical protein